MSTFMVSGHGVHTYGNGPPNVSQLSQVIDCDKATTSMFSVVRAAAFAAKWHGSQTRKDAAQTAYITHPLMVASILESVGCTEKTVIGGILHDVLDDTECTENEMTLVAGAELTELVLEVTHNKHLGRDQKHRKLCEQLPHMSLEAVMIKMADRTHNLRDLKDFDCLPSGFTEEKVFDYAKKSRELYQIISDRKFSSAPAVKLLPMFHRAIRDIEELQERE